MFIIFSGLFITSCSEEGGVILDIQSTALIMGNNALGKSANSDFENTPNLSALNCNQIVSHSFQNSNTVGPRTWTITRSRTWALNCDAQNQSVSFDIDGNGTLDFDGPNLSKDINRSFDINISDIEQASDEWLYNANHNRQGVIQSFIGNQNTLNTNLTFGSTDIVVSKITQQIVSGTFQINFTATNSNGNTINRGATVVFNGNQTATVTLNNGTTFDVSW